MSAIGPAQWLIPCSRKSPVRFQHVFVSNPDKCRKPALFGQVSSQSFSTNYTSGLCFIKAICNYRVCDFKFVSRWKGIIYRYSPILCIFTRLSDALMCVLCILIEFVGHDFKLDVLFYPVITVAFCCSEELWFLLFFNKKW